MLLKVLVNARFCPAGGSFHPTGGNYLPGLAVQTVGNDYR